MDYLITTEENTESLKYTEGNTLIQAVLDLFKSMVCI